MIRAIKKKEDLAREAGVLLFRKNGGELVFKGNSMMPNLEEGYKLKFAPESPVNLKSGDLIVYEKNGIIVCHRFLMKIKTGGKWYLLEKGDNNLFPTFITGDCLLGRVEEIYQRDKILLDSKKYAKTPFYAKACSFFWFIFFIRSRCLRRERIRA